MIPDQTIERVREAANIVEIVGEHVKLKRVGNSFRGPCPFHNGKDPNFAVSPKGGFVCFVCHEKGDVFTFVQKRLGLDFAGAVRYVGERSGVEVVDVVADRQGPDPREPFWEINAAAEEFFRRELWSERGAAVQRYLEQRSVDRSMADAFGLGYSPKEAGALRKHLEALGFDDKRQLEAGLLHVREGETEMRPRFRNRLMFPIHDQQGRTIAFGGRVMDDRQPKYINSAETPVFVKGSALYGLHSAKGPIRRDDRVLIVEGYFDAMRLVHAGIESVVAPLGTALTGAQADLLRRYTRNAFLLYDSDKAGLKATFRSGDILLSRGFSVQVVTLPQGHDPDSFTRDHGREGMERQLEGAIDVFERKIQILQRGGWFSDLRRKRVALDRLLPTIRSAADAITRGLYLSRAAESVGVGTDVLERELRQAPAAERPRVVGRERAAPEARVRKAERRQSLTEKGASAERELVRVLLHRRQYIEPVVEQIGPWVFRDVSLAQIFQNLVRNSGAPVEQLAETLDEDAIAFLNLLSAEGGGLDQPGRIVQDCLAVLRQRELGEEIDAIDRQIPLADDAQKDQLVQKKRQLTTEINALGGRRWKSFGRARPEVERES